MIAVLRRWGSFRKWISFSFLALALSCLDPLLSYSAVSGSERKDSPAFRNAVTLFEQGEREKAIESIKKIIAAEPLNGEAHEQLGYFLLGKGQLDDALASFMYAFEINPALRGAKTGAGLVLMKKGEMSKAEDLLRKALILNPYPSMTYYALGVLYEAQKEYARSIDQFKEVLKIFRGGKK